MVIHYSRIVSNSDIPLLYYRSVESMFCLAFYAEDLTRKDDAIDVKKDNLGINLKTFRIGNNNTYQKISEFDKKRDDYYSDDYNILVRNLSILRNQRLDLIKEKYNVSELIYHCVLRDVGRIIIFEEPMYKIDISNINNIDEKRRGTVTFDDGISNYAFMKAKSTLKKKFTTNNNQHEFSVEIHENPIIDLEFCYDNRYCICKLINLGLKTKQHKEVII